MKATQKILFLVSFIVLAWFIYTLLIPWDVYDKSRITRTNLASLRLAMLEYAIDNNNHLPDLSTERALHDHLIKYTNDNALFYSGVSHDMLLANPYFSSKDISFLHGSRVLLYDPSTNSDNQHLVIYASGTEAWLTNAQLTDALVLPNNR